MGVMVLGGHYLILLASVIKDDIVRSFPLECSLNRGNPVSRWPKLKSDLP